MPPPRRGSTRCRMKSVTFAALPSRASCAKLISSSKANTRDCTRRRETAKCLRRCFGWDLATPPIAEPQYDWTDRGAAALRRQCIDQAPSVQPDEFSLGDNPDRLWRRDSDVSFVSQPPDSPFSLADAG